MTLILLEIHKGLRIQETKQQLCWGMALDSKAPSKVHLPTSLNSRAEALNRWVMTPFTGVTKDHHVCQIFTDDS